MAIEEPTASRALLPPNIEASIEEYRIEFSDVKVEEIEMAEVICKVYAGALS